MRVKHLLTLLVALSLVLGSLPAAAMASAAAPSTSQQYQLQDNTSTNGTVQSDRLRASTGQQLSTVLEVTDDEVTNAIEESSAEAAFASAAQSERAELLASRASTLRDRTDELVDDRRAATAAFEAGNLSASEYAQRIAVLSGQASTVSEAFSRLDQRAESVPAAELEAAGYDTEANTEARSQLQSVSGSSAQALLDQYTGLSSGEFSIDHADGVSIEVESDDGERSREYERDQPGDGSFVLNQSEAVASAEDALSADHDGEWALRSIKRDSDGYFELEFSFYGPTHAGEAELSVDGQTGEIFEIEEEIEPRDRDEDDEDADETPLSITVESGEPAPGATVTLQVTEAGVSVADADVEIDDQVVGTTDENGQLTVTLPADDEVDIKVEAGDREGELELSLGAEREQTDDDEDDERDELSVTVVSGDPAPNATVTIEVTQSDEPVANASVNVNDERAGLTDENGQLTITLPDGEEVDIKVEFDDTEGELEFEFVSGEQDTEADDEQDTEADDEQDTEADDEQDTEADDEQDTEADDEQDTEADDEQDGDND